MTHALINGLKIHYQRFGSGQKLLLLNGSGTTIAESAPLIQEIAASFDVVVADQRGLGESAHVEGSYEMSDLARDAIGLVDHLGWTSFRVLGVSFGGMIAQELCVTIPERIERLALLCTSSGGSGGSSYPLDQLHSLDPASRVERYVEILDTRFTPDWLATHDREAALVDLITQRQFLEKPDDIRIGEAQQLDARSRHDVFDRLSRISCPTFIAAGAFDGIAPPSNSSAMAAQIPDATCRIYEGGHMFMFQDRTAIPEILTFLSSNS